MDLSSRVRIELWHIDHSIHRYISPYPNVLDERGRIAMNYGVTGIPEKFFIDPGGHLARKFVGPTDPLTLRAALDDLLTIPALATVKHPPRSRHTLPCVP